MENNRSIRFLRIDQMIDSINNKLTKILPRLVQSRSAISKPSHFDINGIDALNLNVCLQSI